MPSGGALGQCEAGRGGAAGQWGKVARCSPRPRGPLILCSAEDRDRAGPAPPPGPAWTPQLGPGEAGTSQSGPNRRFLPQNSAFCLETGAFCLKTALFASKRCFSFVSPGLPHAALGLGCAGPPFPSLLHQNEPFLHPQNCSFYSQIHAFYTQTLPFYTHTHRRYITLVWAFAAWPPQEMPPRARGQVRDFLAPSGGGG